MANQVDAGKDSSWGLVVFFMILFFPIGIALIVSKLHREKHRYVPNGKAVSKVGWFVIAMGVIGMLINFSHAVVVGQSPGMGSFVTSLLVFGGGGYALIRHGHKYRKRGEQVEKYSTIIFSQSRYSLDEIAAVYPKHYEQVCRDLQRIIYDGFYPGCHLDLIQRKFISPDVKARSKERTAAQDTPEPQERKSPPQKLKVVKCPNCGATNTVKHQVGECEYCGSPLI